MVKALYGIFLLKKGKSSEGVKKLDEALALGGDDPNIHYNLGLAYFDLKDFDKALASAHKAYQLGFQLPGLRSKLEKAGKWKDPVPVIQPDDTQARVTESVPDGASKE